MIKNPPIKVDFVCAGKPEIYIANKGVKAKDISSGIIFQQQTIPYGNNWKPISSNNVFVPLTTAGDVTGPGSSTNDNIVLWNGSTGKIIKNSDKKLADFQELITPSGVTTQYYAGDKTFRELPSFPTVPTKGIVAIGHTCGTTTNPSDSQTLYWGSSGSLSAVSTQGINMIYNIYGRQLTIKAVDVFIRWTPGTAGFKSNAYLRYNNTTDILITDQIEASATNQNFVVTGLNQAWVAGEYVEIKMTNPAWTPTNPTNFGGWGYIYCEYDLF